MGVKRVLQVVAAVCLTAACSGSSTTSAPTSTRTASTSSAVPTTSPRGSGEGCGSSRAGRGAPPTWAEGGPTGLRYVTAAQGDVIGFLFADPLVAPPGRTAYSNKILWIVRLPRQGSALVLDGMLPGSGSHVHVERPAGSGPGEIYPSIIDVPVPGCWHFTLVWAGHTDDVDLLYVPAP